jgi:hypothetical protein
MSPHVILDAKKATGRESLYLDAIGRRLLRREAETGRPGEVTGGGGDDREAGKGRDKPADVDQGHGRGELSTSSHAGRNGNTVGSAGNRAQTATATPRKQGGSVTGPGKDAPPPPPTAGGRDADERVAAAWPLFWKYFNGRCALERIALQEDMKRKDAWNLLTGMSEYLLTVRHW